MKPTYRCWAEIDLTALRENLASLRNRVGGAVQILTVVKADAYGHGLRQIAALLMQSGTDVFGVANLVEAEAISTVGKGWPILMLGACLPQEVDRAAGLGIMPTISSPREAEAFSAAALRFKTSVRVHVKVDTGMGRLGVASPEARSLIGRIVELPGLELNGIYTHYASAEDDPDFSREQQRRFRTLLGELRTAGVRVPVVHSNNSAAVLCEPDTDFNMVRPGLLVYGVTPPGSRAYPKELLERLRPALAWHCRVSFVKAIPTGTRLSYGGAFVAPRPMRIATLTAGYGDGYLRAGSHRAQVLIGGRRCPIVGRITMDQMLADVSALAAVEPGDPVTLIGCQGGESISVQDLADWFGTVPWEVLTSITYRVPRIYRGGQAA